MPKPPRNKRRTVARHGRLSSPRPLAQLATILAAALAVILVSGAGVAAYIAYDLTATFAEDAVELEGPDVVVPPGLGAPENAVTIFVAGTDECEPEWKHLFGARCTGPDSEGKLNDVNLLVHISAPPRRVTVVSFPRDLEVPVPECTNENGQTTSEMRKQPLNSTYMVGGLACAAKTVSKLSGLPIGYAAAVSFGGVIKITDALGGVDVCLSKPIVDRNTGLNLPAGTHNVAGVDALKFLRTRYGVGDGSDLGRVSNQQQYMSRLVRKLVGEDTLSDPALLYRLARTVVGNVEKSESMTNPLALVQIALAVKEVPFEEIVFVQYPSLTDPDNVNKVVPNTRIAAPLWAALQANQPLQLTGKAGANGAVVIVEPTAPPVEPSVDPTATPTPGAPAAPVQEAVELSPLITGSTAAQETCSSRK